MEATNLAYANCKEAVYSNEVYDYIINYPAADEIPSYVLCTSKVDSQYSVLYIDAADVPSPEERFFDYGGMPKLYSLLDNEGNPGGGIFQPISLEDTGILAMQQGSLKLSGEGVILGFVDTGLDFANPVFRTPEGDTRIISIWDQTADTPPQMPMAAAPEGFLYGVEYSREVINQALSLETPTEILPFRDAAGHGTALASAAAGSVLPNSGFVGAAYNAELVVVKLKPAKQYLKKYYVFPDGKEVYQENDIMLAISYCLEVAQKAKKPLVLCLALGCGLGSHRGTGNLPKYIDRICEIPGCFVVTAAGNEGDAAHHYTGTPQDTAPVELNVTGSTPGFYMEIWGRLPNLFTFSLTSPGGETLPFIRPAEQGTITYGFVFERTRVSIRSTLLEQGSGEQLIRLRFENPTQGIWIFRMDSLTDRQYGIFDMWLPQKDLLTVPVYFLKPDPYITITDPGYSENALTVGYYDPENGTLAPASGRGFCATGQKKPDLTAPGVNVSTIRGPITGSGIAAALTAGAAALLYQWLVAEDRFPPLTSAQVKSFLILGTKHFQNLSYPNREWGFGKLDLEQSFLVLAQN